MINAGIAGLGWWGRTLVNAVQSKSEAIRFVQAAVRDPAKSAEYAQSQGLSLASDYEALLDNPEVDAVVLATPHSVHTEQVLAAAAARKHVFCEKPLAMSRAEAERMVRACQDAGVILAVGQNKRFWASMVELRKIVDSGDLGTILHIESHSSNQNSANFSAWREDPQEAPGGGMTGSGVHILDAMVSVAGSVATVNASLMTQRSGADPRDTITALMTFQNGISGTLAAVRATPLYWRVHVFGDQGSVESLSETQLVVRKSGGVVEHREVPAINSVFSELEAFALAIRGEAPFPITTQDMVETAAAFEAILQSVRTGQTVRLKEEAP